MTPRPPRPGTARLGRAGSFFVGMALVLPLGRDLLLVVLATVAFAIAITCFVVAYRQENR